MNTRSTALPDHHYKLPEDYLEIATEYLPYTVEESLGTYYSEWNITSWSALDEQVVNGPVFKSDYGDWKVLLYPKGNNGLPNNIAMYLENVECKEKTNTADICAQFSLCVVDPTDPGKFYHQEAQHRFNQIEADWGFTNYMDLTRLTVGDERHDPLVIDDALKIIFIIRIIKDPTGVLWHNFQGYDSKEMTGYVGLYNQGATCYMNSLFQSLFFTNLYRKSVYQIPTENDDPNNSSILALQRLFYNLQYSDTAVSTTELTKSFGWNSIDSFMQHDIQEFNRLLQDIIENKMRGTEAEDSIRQLFVGKMKSYIKCINVDFESSRSEDFYDIQLNVKGCKTLEESFKNYVLEETLEGDNKYMAEGHGLQDAKKGVIFENFPPVLHLQLKRFEYDMMKDTMVKINDRHEFPAEIDLEPYLSDSADKSQSHKYILHSVLVHVGDLTSGHYFAFVRPTQADKWYKFDDDRVTPVTKHEVFEDNFGGETEFTTPKHRQKKRFTNAYMLVYLRESHQEQILEEVTQQDVPVHLVKRIREEEEELKRENKRRAEEHLYLKTFVVTENSVMSNTELGLFSQGNDGLTMLFRRKDEILGDFLEEYTKKYGQLRARNIINRENHSIRPDSPFKEEQLKLSLEELGREMSEDYPYLRIFMESPSMETGIPHFPAVKKVLLFIKLFDPQAQAISTIGKVYVDPKSPISSVEEKLKKLARFELDTEIDIYEELHDDARLLIKNATFIDNEIIDCDILCIQKKLANEEIQLIMNEYKCTNIIEYIHYLRNRVSIFFSPVQRGGHAFNLKLQRNMSYHEVVHYLGYQLSCDPQYILLRLPGAYDGPGKPWLYENITLSDILSCIRQTRNVYKLYYDVLNISLSEYKSRKLIKLNICYPTLSHSRYVEFPMPKLATVSDLVDEIEPEKPFRICQQVGGKFFKVLRPSDYLERCVLDDAVLYAEPVPEEENEMDNENGDFFISVFHYQKELTQTHSVPFNFLVKKDEELHETKKRLQQRTGLSDEEWKQVKISIVTNDKAQVLKDDNYKLADYHFKSNQLLGLDHVDPLKKYNNAFTDRGLYIRD